MDPDNADSREPVLYFEVVDIRSADVDGHAHWTVRPLPDENGNGAWLIQWPARITSLQSGTERPFDQKFDRGTLVAIVPVSRLSRTHAVRPEPDDIPALSEQARVLTGLE